MPSLYPCPLQHKLQNSIPKSHFNPLQSFKASLCTVIDFTVTASAIINPVYEKNSEHLDKDASLIISISA